jgi:predicted small metal-binding protein
MPSFKCKDIGMTCNYETSASTEEELMEKIKKTR